MMKRFKYLYNKCGIFAIRFVSYDLFHPGPDAFLSTAASLNDPTYSREYEPGAKLKKINDF